MADKVFEAFIPMVVGPGFFSLIAWIAFVFVDGKRRREQLKVSSEFHAKIFEKRSSRVSIACTPDRCGRTSTG